MNNMFFVLWIFILTQNAACATEWKETVDLPPGDYIRCTSLPEGCYYVYRVTKDGTILMKKVREGEEETEATPPKDGDMSVYEERNIR